MTTLRTFLILGAPGVRLPAWSAVTAMTEEDALELLRSNYMPDGVLPELRVEELPVDEIQTRIGNADFGVPVVRGIWYPHLDNP